MALSNALVYRSDYYRDKGNGSFYRSSYYQSDRFRDNINEGFYGSSYYESDRLRDNVNEGLYASFYYESDRLRDNVNGGLYGSASYESAIMHNRNQSFPFHPYASASASTSASAFACPFFSKVKKHDDFGMSNNIGSDSDSDMDVSDGEDPYPETYIDHTPVRKFAPIFSADDPDQHDTSGAFRIQIDGPTLKEINEFYFKPVFNFSFVCLRKGNLDLFSHPGEPLFTPAGKPLYGRELESLPRSHMRRDPFYTNLANNSLQVYNQFSKETELKLKKIKKVNYYGNCEYYLTFTAITKDINEPRLYQAAFVKDSDDYTYLLGLLRECTTGKILVIMSVTCVEQELADIRQATEDWPLARFEEDPNTADQFDDEN